MSTPRYRLYGGSSCDGRCSASFVGATDDRDVALAHLVKINASPYNFGYVAWHTATTETACYHAEQLPA